MRCYNLQNRRMWERRPRRDSIPGDAGEQQGGYMVERPHGRDLRNGRFSEPHRIYLVTTATHRRQAIFTDWRLGRVVVNVMRAEQPRAETLAYVLMPDHLHWLMQLTGEATLPQVVQTVKSVSGHRLTQLLHRNIPIWQTGFHDHALRGEEDVAAIARYVVANPLRAGLVRRLGDYPLWDARWL